MKISNLSNAVNRSYSRMQVNHNQSASKDDKNSKVNKDAVSISQSARNAFGKQSKQTSMLESLVKRKETLLENKNSLLERTMKNGTSIESVQAQLDEYDQQIKDIDEQISQAMMEDQKDALETKGKEKKEAEKTTNDKNIEGQINNNTVYNFIQLDGTVEQMEQLHSLKTNMESEIKTTKSEMSLDSMTGISHSSKLEKISNLEKNINNINTSISEILNDVNDSMQENNQGEVVSKEEIVDENFVQSKEIENKISNYVKNQERLNEQEKESVFQTTA